MTYVVTEGSGSTFDSDDISGVKHPRYKVQTGAPGTATDVSNTNPMPVREPIRGSALGKGGITSSASSQSVVAANSSRIMVEISNAGATGVWLSFGSAAVAGQGVYLPAKSTGDWPTTAQVFCINEASGSNGAIGYTEW